MKHESTIAEIRRLSHPNIYQQHRLDLFNEIRKIFAESKFRPSLRFLVRELHARGFKASANTVRDLITCPNSVYAS